MAETHTKEKEKKKKKRGSYAIKADGRKRNIVTLKKYYGQVIFNVSIYFRIILLALASN